MLTMIPNGITRPQWVKIDCLLNISISGHKTSENILRKYTNYGFHCRIITTIDMQHVNSQWCSDDIIMALEIFAYILFSEWLVAWLYQAVIWSNNNLQSTLLVLKLSYSKKTRRIPWLTSGHQEPWYRPVSQMRALLVACRELAVE